MGDAIVSSGYLYDGLLTTSNRQERIGPRIEKQRALHGLELMHLVRVARLRTESGGCGSVAKANQTSKGEGIPVEELDDEECPKVQSETEGQATSPRSRDVVCRSSSRAVSYNQLFDETAFVYDKTRSRLVSIQVYASVSAVCHAMRRNRWDKGWPTNAGSFGAGQLPVAEKECNVGTPCLQL